MYKSEEYQALLTAQRKLVSIMESGLEERDQINAASALARIVDMKRVLRGQPAPKPETGLRKRTVPRGTTYLLAPEDPSMPQLPPGSTGTTGA